MSIEINDSNRTSKYKTKKHTKATSSNIEIVRIQNKVNGNENKGINIQPHLNLLMPTKKTSRGLSKSRNLLECSFKAKKKIVDKKEKEKENEKENKEKPNYHKIKALYQRINNFKNSNENLNQKFKKKPNLNIQKNTNENDILRLVTFANKIYGAEEHFQKNIFTKRDKNNPSRPNTKRSMYNEKKSVNNEINYKISKELFPESGNKNIHFRRRLSDDFIKSKNNNNCNLSKIKRNMSKENEDDTKILFDSQENNNKIKNNKCNNNDLDSKNLNSQKLLIKVKALNNSKSKDYNNNKSIKEVKKEQIINKSINKNNLNKVNTQKTNNTKSNNNKSQNQDLENIKKERKKLFKKYRNNHYCFLCCLKSKNDDSDKDE